MMRTRHLFAWLALVAVVGCGSDVTGPPEVLRPELDLLVLQTSPTGQVVSVRAVPEDPDLEIEPGQRVPIALATSSGDSEEATLVGRICEDGDGEEFVCDELIVGMEKGHEVEDVAHLFDDIDATLLDVLFEDGTEDGGQVGHLKIFGGDVDETIATAADWPDARYAERNGIVRIQLEGVGDSVRVPLHSDLPSEVAEPEPDDGILQIQPADTVTTEYVQPDGSQIDAEIVVGEQDQQ